MERKIYKTKLKELNRLLREADSVFLTAHKRPDGDALAATLALKIHLESLGKKVAVSLSGEVESMWNFMPGYGPALFKDQTAPAAEEYDVYVICDACEIKRTNVSKDRISCNRLIYIDHHTDRVGEKCLMEVARSDKAATSEIIFEFFKANDIKIGKDAATCLLAGLFTDTGGFMHANTTSNVMQIASELMRAGAPLSLIAKKTYSNKTVNILNVWGRALARSRLNSKNKMAFSYITQKDLEECRAKVEDLSGVTNILGSAEESAYSLLLTEAEGNTLKGSLRSEEYKNCDVSQIAKLLGGGGHKLASGFELKGKIVDEKGEMAVA